MKAITLVVGTSKKKKNRIIYVRKMYYLLGLLFGETYDDVIYCANVKFAVPKYLHLLALG